MMTFLLFWAGSAQAIQSFTNSAWTADSNSGIESDRSYTAYHFGTSESVSINGITFTGADGANPSVDGVFSVSGMTKTLEETDNQLDSGSGSQDLADNFIYGGMPSTITREGLTSGTQYVMYLYSVGWGDAEACYVMFSDGSMSEALDQNAYGDEHGIRFAYSFVATSETQTLTMTPLDTANTFHFHGFALRATPIFYVSTEGFDSLAVSVLLEKQRQRLCTTNLVERQNRKIKRRTRAFGLFPNEPSFLLLVSAILMEVSEDWRSA
jgi:hypothetical protein